MFDAVTGVSVATAVSGNYAKMDQELALEYIYANIGNIGGDTASIAIKGESTKIASSTWTMDYWEKLSTPINTTNVDTTSGSATISSTTISSTTITTSTVTTSTITTPTITTSIILSNDTPTLETGSLDYTTVSKPELPVSDSTERSSAHRAVFYIHLLIIAYCF